MAWAYFQNQAAFDAYHNAVCADMAIPHAGYSSNETVTQVSHQWTDAWVEPIQIKSQGNVRTWGVHIPDSHLVTYDPVIGLTALDSEVVFNENGTVTVKGQVYTLEPNTLTYKKAKPPTWTDKYGVTYDTTTGKPV